MNRPIVALIIAGSLTLAQAQTKESATHDETVAARDKAAEQALKNLELKENQEALSGDLSTLDHSVAADFIGFDSGYVNGKYMVGNQDKEAVVKGVKGLSPKLADAKVYDLEARVHGSTGVTRGRVVIKTKDGKTYENHFLDVWEKRHGQWVQVAAGNAGQQTN